MHSAVRGAEMVVVNRGVDVPLVGEEGHRLAATDSCLKVQRGVHQQQTEGSARRSAA